jgi:CRP-like cAMP-binding protein
VCFDDRRAMKDHCRGCPVLTTSFFSALKGPERDLFLCHFVHGKYRKRHVIFQEGNPATRVFALKAGLIKTYKTSSDGKLQLIDLLRPGEVFGLDGISHPHYSVTAEVLADAEICFFDTARFTELLARNPALAQEIIHILSSNILDCRNRMLGFGTKTASARLAAFLLSLLPRSAGRDGAVAQIDLPISRTEVADLIGARLETVSRLLADMQRRKLLSVRGSRIRVADRSRLEEAAAPF